MENQLIHLEPRELDKPIYRVFSLSRFKEIFDNNEIVLVKPALWDDPFENFIMNSIGKTRNGDRFKIGFREKYYGQCWTLTKESDAIWRIYAPDKDGVKVRTTIRKLITTLYQSTNDFAELSCFIGKVNYHRREDIKRILGDSSLLTSMIMDQSGRGQAETLLMKRWAFRHEKEVRLIYQAPETLSSKIHRVPINPMSLIDEITFDPRMDTAKYIDEKSSIRKLGFRGKFIQ